MLREPETPYATAVCAAMTIDPAPPYMAIVGKGVIEWVKTMNVSKKEH